MTPLQDRPAPRALRSFVKRSGRLTPGQRRAMDAHWDRFAIDARTSPRTWFPRPAPLTLEIGFGTGECLLRGAREHPERNFLGIEVYDAGLGQVLQQAAAENLENLRVCQDDAAQMILELPEASLDEAWIFFPDPWPKKRHHKRRLIAPDFVQDLARALGDGARLLLATDWADYAEQMLTVLDRAQCLANVAGAGCFASRPDARTDTRFARRGRRLGHGEWDLLYVRRPRPTP